MASGKSLELAKIKPAEGSVKCTCGESFTSHIRKDKKGLLKKYDDGTHKPLLGNGWNRETRRRLT